ncbi:MAG: hypothetical protein JNK04_20495 [Myxococcales bacterium]|nr:hypothetical protein [Myxococcales bacterium]
METAVVQNSLKQDIQKLVDGFASDLERLVRQAAVRAVSDALGAPGASAAKPAVVAAKAGGRRNKKPAKSPAAVAARPAKAAKPAKGKTRIRRNDSQIDGLANQIHDYVASHPGQRAEQIKSALKIPSNNWGLPIKRLLDSGRLVAKGEKRATTYTRGTGRPAK